MNETEERSEELAGSENEQPVRSETPEQAEEVSFPKRRPSAFPEGDATSDVFSPESMNRNASAGQAAENAARAAQEQAAAFASRYGAPAPQEAPDEPQETPAAGGDGADAQPAQPEQPAQTPDPYAGRQPGAYPYGGQQPAPGAYPYAGQQPTRAPGQAPGPYAGQPGQSAYPYGGQQPPLPPYAGQPGGDYYRSYSNAGSQNTNGGPYPYAGQKGGGYAYEEPAPRKKSRIGVVLFVLLVLALLCVLGFGIAKVLSAKTGAKPGDTAQNTEKVENLDELETLYTPERPAASETELLPATAIYQKVLPSSVGVLVYSKSSRQLASEGSGVIFNTDNDGKYTYIVTCAHVISDSNVSVMVQLYNEKEYKAEIMGYDGKTDIGVLRIEEHGLAAAEIGDSSKLGVGETVYAIGNPGGTEFANSFTGGMISAIDRPVSSSDTGYTMECIQHTAAINPGNSGGALVNEYGQVIGINSMKIVADEYEGMGFAVPSSVFVKVVNEIIEHGYVTNRPKVGITYLAASSEQAYAMFVAMNHLPAGSIIVYSISPDSSLAETDVTRGDLITKVNGKELENSSDLSEMVEKGAIGDKLTLTIVRIHSDYTYDEFDVVATLVEDKGDIFDEEETTTSYFDHYFDNRDSGGYGGYDDFFDDFFDRYFGGNP